jgi:hypothetical protein
MAGKLLFYNTMTTSEQMTCSDLLLHIIRSEKNPV